MFAKSGKQRKDFYREMLVEVGLCIDLSEVEFGEKAMRFYDEVMDSLHRDHLLVFYSVGLLLSVLLARSSGSSAQLADDNLEVIYQYFENSLPLGGKFLKYAKDDTFFKCSLDGGRLSQINWPLA